MGSKKGAQRSDQAASQRETLRASVQKPEGRILQAHPSVIIQQARTNPTSLTSHQVLQLQRSIGNQAVTKLLAGINRRRSAARAEGSTHQGRPQGSSPAGRAEGKAFDHGLAIRPLSARQGQGLVGRKLVVGDDEYVAGVEPLVRWGLTPAQKDFYKYMLKGSSPTFTFVDRDRMLAFVRRYSNLYEQNADLFTDAQNAAALETITDARRTNFTEQRAVINAEITVTTEEGTQIMVHPFASKNRHLLAAFRENQASPRAAKVSNTIVKWLYKFKEKFLDYVDVQAQAIKANKMLMGYEPSRAVHYDTEISFITDQPELPNNSYDRTNAIHSFPSAGTELATLTQDQFARINVVLSHLYQTDNNQMLRVKLLNPAIPTDPVVIGNQRNVEAEVNTAINNLRRLGLPAARPANTATAAADLHASWQLNRGAHYNPSLKSALQNLHRLLVTYKLESEIATAAPALLVTVNEAVAAYDALDNPGQNALKWLEPTILTKIAAWRLAIQAQNHVPPTLNQQLQTAKRTKVDALVVAGNVQQTLDNFYNLYEAARNVADPASVLI